MKTLILILLITSGSAFAVCSSPISRTNNTANQVLTSIKYNLDLNTVYNKVNNLPGDCITDESISTVKIADEAVTADKLSADVLSQFIPPGTILPYGGTIAPTGFFLCNGQQVSRTTYAALFAVVGTSFGSGNGSTTFHVPDLRGRFLRGVDGGVARDPNRTTRTAMNTGGNAADNVGSIQGYATARPVGSAFSTNTDTHFHDVPGGSGSYDSDGDYFLQTDSSSGREPNTENDSHSHTITGGGDSETRPINAGVNFIIKY